MVGEGSLYVKCEGRMDSRCSYHVIRTAWLLVSSLAYLSLYFVLTTAQKWDLEETSAKPGPYQEIVESDVFVNCIYLSAKIPPFIDHKSLSSSNRKLTVVCDVSCANDP